MEANRLLRSGSLVLAAQIPVLVFGAAYGVVLARWLGQETFGIYATIWALVSLCATLGEEGLAQAVTREVARAPDLAPVWLANGLLVAVSQGTVMGGLVPLAALGLGCPRWALGAAGLAGLMLCARAPMMLLAAGLSGIQKAHLSALLTVVTASVSAALGLPLVLGGLGLGGVFAAALVANVGALGLALWLVHRRLPPIDVRRISVAGTRRLVRAALPFGARSILGAVYFRADALLLAALAGFEAAGLYRAAYKVVELTLVVPAALNQTLFPLAAALHVDERERLRTIFKRHVMLLVALALPGCLVLAWVADPMVRIVYGPAYAEAGPVLSVLSGAIFLLYVNSALGNLVMTGDRQSRATVLALVATVALVGLELLLIPRLGPRGAAMGLTGATFLTVLLFVPLARSYLRPVAV